MPLKVLEFFKDIDPKEFRLLAIIERQMAYYEFVPVEDSLIRLSPFSTKLTKHLINKIWKKKLIILKQQHELGTALTFRGYDALALKALLEKDIISEVGPEIGAGKESDIRLAKTPDGREVILKTHRLGALDFRTTRKKRSFLAEKKHLSPLYQSRLSATREYEVLTVLSDNKVSVPRPVGHSRHMVVQEIIKGQDLYRIKKNQFNVEKEIPELFNQILSEVEKIVKLGIIHGDLSEYNIRLNEDAYPVIFDWPQYIETTSPSARETLIADLTHIVNYFQQKFRLSVPIDVISYADELLNLKTNLSD